ncbi:MAG: DUF2066 domain-containing protein [Proteobacteria bacterium]|nr:DUF2066 domain-containing protein [Pseudomonadota bacterium]
MIYPFLSHAASPDNHKQLKIYEASVQVDEKSTENELINKAFAQVLIKVSGRSDIGQSPHYTSILEQSKNTISQFRYDNKLIADNSEAVSIESLSKEVPIKESEQKKQKWFWAKFNSKSVDALLKNANIAVWSNVRPATLVWFSQEINGQRLLQSQHEAPDVHKILQQASQQRGITLKFPFMDLQDQNSISSNDIWNNYSDTILLASRRYLAQTTLTIRLFQEKSGLWNSQWTLLLLGKSQFWTIKDKDKTVVLSSGINKLTDKLAQQFTSNFNRNDILVGEDKEIILLQINNVRGYPAFQKLNAYFSSLASVRSATLLKVEQDHVIYKVKFLGGKNTLIQEIKLMDLLQAVERNNIDNSLKDNQDYKAVILDDLDKKLSQKNQPNNTSGQASVEDSKVIQAPSVLPKVEKLTPELEYWFVQ